LAAHARAVARPFKVIDARHPGAYDPGRPTPNIPLTAPGAEEGRSMKLRHTAALALVGWYLMVSPPVLFSIHDSAAECDQGLVAFYNQNADIVAVDEWEASQVKETGDRNAL
jgi:hypothetical protein